MLMFLKGLTLSLTLTLTLRNVLYSEECQTKRLKGLEQPTCFAVAVTLHVSKWAFLFSCSTILGQF